MHIEGSDELAACINPDLLRFKCFPDIDHDTLSETPRALKIIEELIAR